MIVSQLCLDVLVTYNYAATLVGLAPGAYTFEVYHRRAGTSPTLALREAVDVR